MGRRGTAARATQAVWQRCDIALPSADDEVALHGDADAATVLQRLRGLGLKVGALKRGAEGPIALDPAETGEIEFPPAARVVDSTAAGDSFNAGFLAAHLLGRALSDCLREGHALASRVVGHRGAILLRDGR